MKKYKRTPEGLTIIRINRDGGFFFRRERIRTPLVSELSTKDSHAETNTPEESCKIGELRAEKRILEIGLTNLQSEINFLKKALDEAHTKWYNLSYRTNRGDLIEVHCDFKKGITINEYPHF